LASYSLGGPHSLDNLLPAHSSCNRHRFFYSAEEFLLILKLGAWIRTLIERETPLGKRAAAAFCKHDCVRAARGKMPKTKPKARAAGAR
jgi:hypothetical protein